MKISERDTIIIEKIIKYCDEINDAHTQYDKSYATFINNSTYRNAVAMCLLQIGELTNHLSDEFKNEFSQIPWSAIKGMRNVVAHQYGSIDTETVWETAESETDDLKNFLLSLIHI